MLFIRKWSGLAGRHFQALRFVLTRVIPIILRTRSRPVIFDKWSGIGDIICTFPAALELKKRHPGSVFIYNCHPEYTCLPRLAGVTEMTASFQNIGIVGHWYSFLLGGYYQFASDDDRPDVIPTEVYIKDFARHFNVVTGDEHPRLGCDPAVAERVKARLAGNKLSSGPLVVIHPGPSWPVREWPRESWIALIQELRRRGCTNAVQLGAASHLTLGAASDVALPDVISLVDQLSLEETVALISQADLFVGIDSGLLHIAVALQIPSVGLWGPTSAHLRFSHANARSFITSKVDCQGCHHRVPRLHWITNCPHDIRCMKTIEVAEVLSACLGRLAEAKMELSAPDERPTIQNLL